MWKAAGKKTQDEFEIREDRSGSSKCHDGTGSREKNTSAGTEHFKYYLAALVSLITFLVYLKSLHNEFVNWDDTEYVVNNPYIRSFNSTFFKWAFFDFYEANWHPLTWISHALDYAIWGLNPLGHHLTNNILHAVNTFLVVLLVVRLLEAAGKFSGVVIPASEARRESFRNTLKDSRPGESPEETGRAGMTENGSMPSPSMGEGYGKSGTLLGVGQSRIYDPHSRLRNYGTVPGPQRPDFPSRDLRITDHDSRLTIHPPRRTRLGLGDSRLTFIAAGVTGLLFGLHPLHVESVAWVSERKDLLCALFFLLSIMAYLKYAVRIQSPSPQSPPLKGGAGKEDAHTMGYRQSLSLSALRRIRRGEKGGAEKGAGDHVPLPWRERARERGKYYLLTLMFFILALMSKPMAVTLPFVLLILDWYPFRRIDSLKTLWTASIEKLPFLALTLISSILTIFAQKAGKAMELMEVVPFATRLLVAVKSVIAYPVKMFSPLTLMPFYPYPENTSLLSLEYVVPIVLVVGITATCLALIPKQKLWISVWTYYVITLMPVLGIVQVGSQSMADRYTYLPSLGPFLVLGVIAAKVYVKVSALDRWSVTSIITDLFLVLVVSVSMSYATMRQIGVWKNSFVFWDYVLAKEPLRVPFAHINLGEAYRSRGQLDMAIEQYRIALRLKPENSMAHNDLGLAYASKGQMDMAVTEFQTAVRLKPDNATAHNNLGLAYASKGLLDMAIEQYRTSIRLRPDFAEVYNNLGNAYKDKGQLGMAIQQYQTSLRLNPGNAEAHFNLGLIFLNSGSFDRARTEFESGLKSKPDDYRARQILNSIVSK